MPPPAPCRSLQARAQKLHCRYDEGLDEGRWQNLEDFARSPELEREEVEPEVWDHFLELAGDANEADNWIPQGFVHSRYRRMRFLGRGGFGQVWEAWDSDLQRSIAIKFIPRKESSEAAHQALGGESHPNICPIHDRVRLGSHTALIMQLLSGGTLAERLEGGRLAPSRAVAITRQLAEALAFMHDREVLHLDIKPANVLFAERTQQDHPFLCDFGVAASQGLHGRRGTPPYMAPEALRGEELTCAADVWSLGVVLYQLLTGELPFGYEWTSDAQRPADPQGIENRIPDLSELCLGMLEADQKSRPTMSKVKDRLQQLPTEAEIDKRQQVASYAESSERSRLHELKRSVERPEHAQLRERVQDLLGEGGLMLIEGEAGSGKTHTAAWLSQDAEGWDSEPIVIYGEARHCDRRPQGLLRHFQLALAKKLDRDPRYFEFDEGMDLRRRNQEVQLRQAWRSEMCAAHEEGRPVLLVLDGMDELGAWGRGLDFLPDPAEIPEGVALVVTSRERDYLEGSIVERGERFRLGLLDEARTHDLVLSVTGCELEADQLERWHKATQGNPSVVVANAYAWKSGGQRADYEPQGGKGIFKEAYRRWLEIDASNLLGLLAVMQPAGKIPLAMAEAGLRGSRRNDMALEIIEGVRDELGDQIVLEGEGERQTLCLRREDFAQWMVEEYWRPRTLEAQLMNAVEFLADPQVLDEIELGVLGRFVLHWDEAKPESEATPMLFERLVDREATDALYAVYVADRGWDASRRVALQALERAADAGSLKARRRLGNHLIDGRGCDRDPERGKRLLINAATSGDPEAQAHIGLRLLEGNGLPQAPMEAKRWLREAVCAGDVGAAAGLRSALGHDDVLLHDIQGDLDWLRKAVSRGSLVAETLLGWILINGASDDEQLKEGEALLLGAAEAGNASAQYELSLFLLDGGRLPLDVDEGAKWLKNAAVAGDEVAQANLGLRLLDGNGFPQDQEEGAKWLKKSVENLNAENMRILGMRLLDGAGLPQDREKGQKWLRIASDADDPVAMTELGRRLLSGSEGLRKDREEALRILCLAAARDDGTALELLRKDRNRRVAIRWLLALAFTLVAVLALGWI